MPSSFILPRRVILEKSLLFMLVLALFWQVPMKTFMSSSFLLFFRLEALSTTPSTIMFNLLSSLPLRLSTFSLTTYDKSAMTAFFMSAREAVISSSKIVFMSEISCPCTSCLIFSLFVCAKRSNDSIKVRT